MTDTYVEPNPLDDAKVDTANEVTGKKAAPKRAKSTKKAAPKAATTRREAPDAAKEVATSGSTRKRITAPARLEKLQEQWRSGSLPKGVAVRNSGGRFTAYEIVKK